MFPNHLTLYPVTTTTRICKFLILKIKIKNVMWSYKDKQETLWFIYTLSKKEKTHQRLSEVKISMWG